VLIADGGWAHGPRGRTAGGARDEAAQGPYQRPDKQAEDEQAEDERRTFYVGMTRARETLTLLEVTGGSHPHLPLLAAAGSAGGDWLLTDAPVVDAPPVEVIARRYTQLTLADLDLGYAGRQPPDAPIHRHLAALQAGDNLGWQPAPPASRRQADKPAGRRLHDLHAADKVIAHPEPAQLILVTTDGQPIARLSRRAAADWLPRSERIEAIRVVALIRRDRSQSDRDFARSLRCDAWEVPLVEIRWRQG
jgi:ATP-dependent DNA helicase RecQ